MPISPMLTDVVRKPAPDAVQMRGLIGKRFHASRTNRLIHQEDEHLLWPFRDHCAVGWYPDNQPYPGVRGDWQGEFMGTWVDAAVLSAWNAGDTALREKVDRMVAEWLSRQEPDGYLGTYDEADRWKAWDVWVQAHDIIGLLSYYRLTQREDARLAAIRIADRILQDFGPGKRTLRDTGPHMGMASSAILEPMMWIYWETADPRYLEFGRWLVDQDWEGEGGPQILSSILAGNGVANTANAKGIEMLIDFAGLLELHRATGEAKYLQAIQMAWEDVVSHHLYITGSASTGEFFPKDFALQNDGTYMIGETCVSMGWLYLNLSLFRLTGDARYLDVAEQTLYNHLMAAQSPDGKHWVYYLGLRDSKRYRWHTDPECCPSRGVRAVAQMPTHIFGLWEDGISVNFYDDAAAVLPLPSGETARLEMQTAYPFDGSIRLSVNVEQPAAFTLRLRKPGWAEASTLTINGAPPEQTIEKNGFFVLTRTWNPSDTVALALEMPIRAAVDRLGNNGRVAITRGPLVFAADSSYLPEGVLLDDVILAFADCAAADTIRVQAVEGSIHLSAQRIMERAASAAGIWNDLERYKRLDAQNRAHAQQEIELVPFFEAGNRSSRRFREGTQPNDEPVREVTFLVWLPYRCL